MNPERKKEIENRIVRAVSQLGEDAFESYKSMSFTGLGQCCRDISVEEFVHVLKSMDGVIIDSEAYQVLVPIKYFSDL